MTISKSMSPTPAVLDSKSARLGSPVRQWNLGHSGTARSLVVFYHRFGTWAGNVSLVRGIVGGVSVVEGEQHQW